MPKISCMLFIIFSIPILMAMEDECSYHQGSNSSLSNFSSQPEEFIQIDAILRKEREAASRYYYISKERFEYNQNGGGDVKRTNYTYLPCFLCCPCCWPCLLIAYGIRHCCPTRSCAEYDRLTEEMNTLQVEIENYDKEARELMMKAYVRTGEKHPEMQGEAEKVRSYEDGVINCSIQ